MSLIREFLDKIIPDEKRFNQVMEAYNTEQMKKQLEGIKEKQEQRNGYPYSVDNN
jgi:hypothetical protein